MALANSPRKTVPLATGEEPRIRHSSGTTTTKRVFFCGVVVEGSENGRQLPEEIQELVLSLGNPITTDGENSMLSTSSNQSPTGTDKATQRKRALTDTTALSSVINELLTSERSYVKRLQILKHDYADPLRNFARSKETAIIPAYEAKTLFGNIDNLLPVNDAFLTDLEKMMTPNGSKTVGGVGDVALRHFKEFRGFEQYKLYYVKREDAQSIFEHELSKRSSRFAAYIDHIKYQSTDPKNRVGLRELLMEPVQRIPRYTLLFRTMLKHMALDDPQRAKIIEADEIASKIALAEADEQTKRAAIFYCLSASIDGFPADLCSNSRRFVDCIDVEDILTDLPLSATASSASLSASTLHCTLFLFDDKLVIVKRPGNGEKGGRLLSGLDGLDKVTKAGGIPTGKKKSGMTFKGVVDVTDVVATDIGSADINLYLETPPQDQSERWSGRQFRSLSVVNPPMPVNLDPTQTEADKQRFLENLWHIQATYRSRSGQSVVLQSDDKEVENRGSKVTIARTYFNVYQRTAYLQESKKTKIVIHIDPLGSADPIPFGIGGPPFARIRVQPLAGGLCRYAVSSSDPSDEGEEDIVQTARVPFRVVQTVHQFGLFEFKTGRDSRPSTPTARSKAAIFGLDAISRNAISRNIFGSRPGSSMGDFFGGSINGHRRAKSTTSRSSTYTQTTTTGDGSLTKFSHRSNSTATAATTMSTMDDNSSIFGSKSSRGRKLLNRGRSAGGSPSDSERESPSRNSMSHSTSRSRSSSRDPGTAYSDAEDEETVLTHKDVNSSDFNLAMQLVLARQNSMNQHGKQSNAPMDFDIPVEETIYEEGPPHPVRPTSRASGDAVSNRSTTPRPDSRMQLESPTRTSRARSLTRQSSERRPAGPRSPSPLPPPKSPQTILHNVELPSMEENLESEPREHNLQSSSTFTHSAAPPTTIPRSKRQVFNHSGNYIVNKDATPKLDAIVAPSIPNTVEPLSIKKKTSLRMTLAAGSPTPARRSYAAHSSRHVIRGSPRRVSPQIRKLNHSTANPQKHDHFDRFLQLSSSTKNDIDSSRRAIKRIKLEFDGLRSNIPLGIEEPYSRPSSPEKGNRTPQPSSPTKQAQERLEEMRQLIGKRQGPDITPRRRPNSIFDTPSRSTASISADNARILDTLLNGADNDLHHALSQQDELYNALQQLATDFRQKSTECETSRLELQNARRQCELVKSLLADATAEKEIMYEAFNEELDSMYNDANLPDDDAWLAMSKDLRQTKAARNNFAKENSQLKRQLAESELQREEWGELLRAHGLIP